MSINRMIALLFGFTVSALAFGAPTVTSDEELVPEIRHERIGELVTQFIQ